MVAVLNILRALWRFVKGSFALILYALTLIVGGLYILAILAPYIPPVYTVVPAVLGLLFPLVLGGYVATLCCWLLLRQWRMVLFLGLVFAISLPSVLVYFPMNRAQKGELLEGQTSFRILSYNVNAFGFRRHSSARPNPVLQYIKASEADIVCLQEALLAESPRYGVTFKQISQYLGEDYPYMHKGYVQTGGSMLILLSRFPINDYKRLPLTSSANGGMMYKVQMPDGETTIFNLHLESFRLKKRDGETYIQFLKDRNAMGLKDAVRGKFAPTFEQHNRQANVIHTIIAGEATDRIIVCGDFNDTPLSYTRRKIATGLSDAFVKAGHGAGITFSTWFFLVRIDHILLGRAFEPVECVVDKSIQVSDHYPIIAEVYY